jgi:hypothetical protein
MVMRCDGGMHKDPEKTGDTSDQAVVSCLCRCGRAPRRKAQRNCHLCHAEANRRYRASVKQQNEVLRRLQAAAGVKD